MMKKLVISALSMILLVVNFACTGGETEIDNKRAAKKEAATKGEPVKTILFFGNSLTAGYGLDPAESFPALVQQKIDSAHLKYRSVNAGVSGETSAGGNSRIDWILKQPVDVFVLE